jgi:hypothetical protein
MIDNFFQVKKNLNYDVEALQHFRTPKQFKKEGPREEGAAADNFERLRGIAKKVTYRLCCCTHVLLCYCPHELLIRCLHGTHISL